MPGRLCCWSGCWCGSMPAHAGVCRSELRPLLLQAQPDPAAIAAVRASCTAEAEAGDADATYQLALFHLGLGGEWNPAAAIPLIRSVSSGRFLQNGQSSGMPNNSSIARVARYRSALG